MRCFVFLFLIVGCFFVCNAQGEESQGKEGSEKVAPKSIVQCKECDEILKKIGELKAKLDSNYTLLGDEFAKADKKFKSISRRVRKMEKKCKKCKTDDEKQDEIETVSIDLANGKKNSRIVSLGYNKAIKVVLENVLNPFQYSIKIKREDSEGMLYEGLDFVGAAEKESGEEGEASKGEVKGTNPIRVDDVKITEAEKKIKDEIKSFDENTNQNLINDKESDLALIQAFIHNNTVNFATLDDKEKKCVGELCKMKALEVTNECKQFVLKGSEDDDTVTKKNESLTACLAYHQIKSELDLKDFMQNAERNKENYTDEFMDIMGSINRQQIYESYYVVPGDEISIIVSRSEKVEKKYANGTTKTVEEEVLKHEVKIIRKKPGRWDASSGFAFIPDVFRNEVFGIGKRDNNLYYVSEEDSSSTLARQNETARLHFSPAVFFSFFPRYRKGKTWNHSLTAGMGLDLSELKLDLSKPVLFLGYNIAFHENISFSLGLSAKKYHFLKGEYECGQEVSTDLEFDDLHDERYRINPFVSLNIRFRKGLFNRGGSKSE